MTEIPISYVMLRDVKKERYTVVRLRSTFYPSEIGGQNWNQVVFEERGKHKVCKVTAEKEAVVERSLTQVLIIW